MKPHSSTNHGTNNPFIIWSVWYLWLATLTTVICTLALFLCSSIIIQMFHLDLILSVSLLSGLLMLPTNFHMMNTISRGKKIDINEKVLCSPLWSCIATTITVNFIGACLCTYMICHCSLYIKNAIIESMENYRINPKYMDTLQWTIKCCGLDSYLDWFSRDWYDHIRDYEWNPSSNLQHAKRDEFVTDSVPLSCCKTGSCVSNYLEEMGTASIYMIGCQQLAYNVVMAALVVQWIMFVSVFIMEFLVLISSILNTKHLGEKKRKPHVYDVKQLLTVNPNFDTSGSLGSASEDSDAENSGSPRKAAERE